MVVVSELDILNIFYEQFSRDLLLELRAHHTLLHPPVMTQTLK